MPSLGLALGLPFGRATAGAPVDPPGPVENLTNDPPQETSITLVWDAPLTGGPVSVYRIQWAAAGTSFAVLLGNDTQATDDYTALGLTGNTSYDFRVRAENSGGVSAWEEVLAVLTLPAAPTGLSATPGDTEADLTWTDIPGLTYTVFSSTVDDFDTASEVDTGLAGPPYTVTGLTNGTEYFFWVSATNASGSGDPSTSASATPESSGGDPDFAEVQLLVQPQGPDGSTTFDDQSSAARTITAQGDAQQDTAVTLFSPATILVDGTDAITVASAAALRPGTGDFTLEFAFRYDNLTGFQTLWDQGYVGSGAFLIQTGSGDGKPIVYLNGSSALTDSSASATTGVWYHYAVRRSGTALTLWRDGVQVASATNSTDINNTDVISIGRRDSTGNTGAKGNYGYIRFTVGTARTITVPTGEFPTS